MAQKLYEESNIQAIANAIRAKNGLTDTYKTSEMADAIEAIPVGGGGDLPEEAFVLTGKQNYRFYNGNWDWFVKAYGDQITTSEISDAAYMFYGSKLEHIPFKLNFKSSDIDCARMFTGCKVKTLPDLSTCKPRNCENMFAECTEVKEIPEDFTMDFSYIDSLTSQYVGTMSNFLNSMYSLRRLPYHLLEHGNPNCSYSVSWLSYGFTNCRMLDEIVDLPLPWTATWTSNAFNNTFVNCYRAKALTFKMPDGAPYTKKWKNMTIDLSDRFGYGITSYYTELYAGIKGDKEAKDDATYQALKDDPDWFAYKVEYSRYNHDSAVATINSLPDTSSYLATAGGTNTIKFKGTSGSATDGGAINTLTEEEIAVAAARGWTVSLV